MLLVTARVKMRKKRKRRHLWKADTLPEEESASAVARSPLKEAAWVTEAIKVKGLKDERSVHQTDR